MTWTWGDILNAVIMALAGTGGTTGLAIAIRRLVTWWRLRSHRAVYRRIHAIYGHLQTIVNETGAARAVILKSENNGGKPKAGCRLFVSILYEAWAAPYTPMKSHWQRREIDQDYTAIVLSKLIQEQEIILSVAEMPEGSQLRDVYEGNGVEKSHIVELGATPDAYWYLSINYGKHPTNSPLDGDPSDSGSHLAIPTVEMPTGDEERSDTRRVRLAAHTRELIRASVSELKKLLGFDGLLLP